MNKQRELLCQQLEVLAERSKTGADIDSASLSNSMNGIYKTLVFEHAILLSLFVAGAYSLVGILVHIKNLLRH